MAFLGNVYVVAVRDFNIHDTDIDLEEVSSLGTTGICLGEFYTSLPAIDISGYLFKKYNTTISLQQVIENVNSLSYRSGAYNYCYNFDGRSGWIFPANVEIEGPPKYIRDFKISGKWHDKGLYVPEYTCRPTTRSNSFEITANNWVTIPKGATYSGGDGSTEVVSSEDGNITRILSDSSNVRFDLAAIEASVGEVRVLDGTTSIYSKNHYFAGSCSISNGLYKVVLTANTITIYYWSGSAYVKIDDFTAGTFSSWYLQECTPDRVRVKTSNNITIDVERGRVPLLELGSVTLTCGSLTPEDQATDTANYLQLGSGLYVATDTAMSIASNVISAGNRWIFQASSGAATVAQNCLCISNLIRNITARFDSW